MILTQSNRQFYEVSKYNYSHIISLVCPDEKELIKPLGKNHLILQMWDIDKPLENKFRKYDPPSKESCVKAVTFAKNAWYDYLKKDLDFRLLIHCDAGVSRSSAVALGVLWGCSDCVFAPNPDGIIFREWLEAKKNWCYEQVDNIVSTGLRRYVAGRYNPGVKPNQHILKIYREHFKDSYFPW